MVWHEATRRRDLDNIMSAQKIVIDGLVKARVILDDSQRWITDIQHEFRIPSDTPGVMVTLTGREA